MRFKFALAAVAVLSSSLLAHADEYVNVQLAESAGSTINLGFAEGGTAAIIYFGLGCGQFVPCYETISFWPLSSDNISYSATGPGSGLPTETPLTGPQPINPAGGYALISTGSGDESSLEIENLATGDINTLYNGDWLSVLGDSYGDVLIMEEPFDISEVAVNVTSHEAAAVTPECSSFVLLGTGFFGVAGVLRKRFA